MSIERIEAELPPSGPSVNWYEAWLLQHGRRARAEAAARAARERQVRWMMRAFAGWAAVVAAAGLAAVWWLA